MIIYVAPLFAQFLSLSHGLSTMVEKCSILPENIAPELCQGRIEEVSNMVSLAIHHNEGNSNDGTRYNEIRSLASEFQEKTQNERNIQVPDYQMVYGELGIKTLATILDAVGLREGERFLDIGSGDGALVMGASLLYGSKYVKQSIGLEIIPGLVSRSKRNLRKLRALLKSAKYNCEGDVSSNIDFVLGDVHESQSDADVQEIIHATTLGICFATTWSAGNVDTKSNDTSLQGRILPKLSKALTAMPSKARIVVIDGKLDCKDGYIWKGDLKIRCPDTAPYSIATLYERQ